MPTALARLSDVYDTVLDRMVSPQDHLAATGLAKVPGVRKLGPLLHELAVRRMFGATWTDEDAPIAAGTSDVTRPTAA
jgi:hypothetical protein